MKHISALIIEDSKYSADLNVRELKKAGFSVDYKIAMGRVAMEKALRDNQWDIILSDNSMPNFNALQALEIRNRMAGDVPFIIISEDISGEDVDRALKDGCSICIAKENLPDLREYVKKLFTSF